MAGALEGHFGLSGVESSGSTPPVGNGNSSLPTFAQKPTASSRDHKGVNKSPQRCNGRAVMLSGVCGPPGDDPRYTRVLSQKAKDSIPARVLDEHGYAPIDYQGIPGKYDQLTSRYSGDISGAIASQTSQLQTTVNGLTEAQNAINNSKYPNDDLTNHYNQLLDRYNKLQNGQRVSDTKDTVENLGIVFVPMLAEEKALSSAERPNSAVPRTSAQKAAAEKVAGEPVSVATGEYIETWKDFFIPAALPYDGARFMGHKSPVPVGYEGPFGHCQTSSFDEVFAGPEPGKLDFHQADGNVVRFDRPFNFLASHNTAYPHLDLRAPWLKQLELRDRNLVKHFRQYDDGIYRLEKTEDLNGNAIIFHRSETGVLEGAETTDGLALAFMNDTAGRRTRIVLVGLVGSRLELARYAYDARGRMTAAECAFGMSVRYYWHPERDLLLRWHNTTLRSETHFTYDDEGRVLHTRTNGIWNDDRFRYDPENRETTYLPAGEERLAQRFRYDENDNVTHETDALGHTLQRVFDAAGFETAVTDANGNTTTKAYDTRGNVKRHVDAEGRATTYAWGPIGTLDMVIDGAGKIRRWESDIRGNTLAETCAEGHRTRFVRDDRGRLLRTIFPDGAEESRAYDPHGRLVAVTDARGGVTRFAHDPFGRVVAETDALGHVTRYEHAAGAGGFSTPTAMIRPDGVRIARAFTEDGMLASVTDGEGRTWRYTYGAFDVLQSIEDPGGGKLSFAYDGEGRVTAVTNQVGVNYNLIRDPAGRVIAEEDFDGRRTAYTRDPGGRVIETKKPDGVRLVYGYDKTDKLTSIKSYAADASASDPPLDETYYWYDRRGLLIKASNLAALVELERDGNGRIIRETVNGRSIESKLDVRGNRIERRIGQSQTSKGESDEGLVAIGRDPLGMVASIAIDDHAPLVFTRDALGRETSRASAKGFRLEQSFDAVSQLMHQRVGSGVAERRYGWDKAGAPTSIDDAIWGETRYTYDVNGQVAKAEFGDGFTEKFAYDPAKNVAGVALQGPGLDASGVKALRLALVTRWRRPAGPRREWRDDRADARCLRPGDRASRRPQGVPAQDLALWLGCARPSRTLRQSRGRDLVLPLRPVRPPPYQGA